MNRFFASLAINSVAILIATAGACIMLFFLLFAAYLALCEAMAPWAAALVTAGAALVFSILVVVIARLISKHGPSEQERKRQRSAAELGELLGKSAHTFVAANSPGLLGGLLAIGFALGFSPKLRKLFMKLL
jgi:membrane protein implicated in regulation of membrane protease activity